VIGSHPLVYEINTRAWLRELSSRIGQPITLADVPQSEIDSWRRLGFTHIWLMGVWTVGPRSREHSLRHFQKSSPFDPTKVLGSPYAVSAYKVSPALGGNDALRHFRSRLASSGLKLILDFVPNHTGLDHPWLTERPDLFIRTRPRHRGSFLQQTHDGPRWLAHGRDPYFDPWLDTAQLDYRNPATHSAMLAELQAISQLCDGLRCDMAMLVLNDIFEKTWKAATSNSTPALTEFWSQAIPAVKKHFPEFLFLAEVYWGLEGHLQHLGFDYTYEKIFYDHLVARRTSELHRHLLNHSPAFLAASAHFLENHDEARIASLLSPEEHRAAALLLLGLPGLRILHEGQLTGAKKRASVHLGSRIFEKADSQVFYFYETLLELLPKTFVGRGGATILQTVPAWEGNPTAENFLLIQWANLEAENPAFDLVAVNFAPHQSQCYAPLQIPNLQAHCWRMENLLGSEKFEREGRELARPGLYLDAPPYAAHLFRFRIK
jgi:glycosidase